MAKTRLLVVGAGGHGRSVAEAAELSGQFAVVAHHATVEDFGHLSVNASMAGGTVLGRGTWMQAGEALGYGVKVPPEVVLAPDETRHYDIQMTNAHSAGRPQR